MSSFLARAALVAVVVGGLGSSAHVVAQEQSGKADAASVYKLRCSMCHGPTGAAKMPGMSFAHGQWKHGSDLKEIAAVIRDGVEGTAMLPFKGKLSDSDIEALARFVRAFDPKFKQAGTK
jgi:mono/diheme cytochrome c family protein